MSLEPRATVETAFRQMFRGWDRVEIWRDVGTASIRVSLALHEASLRSVLDPGAMLDRLWPKQPGPSLSGVRFRGRRVSQSGHTK